MVAGHSEHFMAGASQPLEEFARLMKLIGPRSLGEIARNHHQLGLELGQPPLDACNDAIVMGAEMQVGEMGDASHDDRTSPQLHSLHGPSMLSLDGPHRSQYRYPRSQRATAFRHGGAGALDGRSCRGLFR